MRWELCSRTHGRLARIVAALGFRHVDPARIFCVRGYGSTSEAWARIWGLPALWQQVLGIGPAYVVEIIEPEFGRLPEAEQDRILIHELLHIPRTFSGAIRPHRTPTFQITRRSVERFYQRYLIAVAGPADGPAAPEERAGRAERAVDAHTAGSPVPAAAHRRTPPRRRHVRALR
ncbi:MAG TPA: putative metallopeptidase [bacterium]|nr:putative metallopeptidase [bacterium]